MASVRMTQELQSAIVSAIDSKYRAVRNAYIMPKEVEEKLAAIGNQLLKEHEEIAKQLVSNFMANWCDVTKLTADVYAGQQVSKSVFNAITTDHWRGLDVQLIETFEESLPDGTNRTSERVIASTKVKLNGENARTLTNMGNGVYEVRDRELLAIASPIFRKWEELDQKRTEARLSVGKLVDSCSTLKRLLDVAPNLRDVVPPHYLERMEEKAFRTNTDKPKVELPTLDESLADEISTVALQADALSALNGG